MGYIPNVRNSEFKTLSHGNFVWISLFELESYTSQVYLTQNILDHRSCSTSTMKLVLGVLWPPVLWPPDAKTDLLKKTLMLGKTEVRRRRGQQRMRCLDGIIDCMDMSLCPGVSDGQGSLACCSPWGCKESNMTEQLNWLNWRPPPTGDGMMVLTLLTSVN